MKWVQHLIGGLSVAIGLALAFAFYCGWLALWALRRFRSWLWTGRRVRVVRPVLIAGHPRRLSYRGPPLSRRHRPSPSRFE